MLRDEEMEQETGIKTREHMDLRQDISLFRELSEAVKFTRDEKALLDQFCESTEALVKVDSSIQQLEGALATTFEATEEHADCPDEDLARLQSSLKQSVEQLEQAFVNTLDEFEACMSVSLLSN